MCLKTFPEEVVQGKVNFVLLRDKFSITYFVLDCDYVGHVLLLEVF